jgi:hypothetical protein
MAPASFPSRVLCSIFSPVFRLRTRAPPLSVIVKCPGCSQWFDMRDLGQIIGHIHDADIDIRESPEPLSAKPNPTVVATDDLSHPF